MPAEFDDILDAIKRSLSGKTNPRTDKAYTDDDFYAMAVSAYKKKYGKNPMSGETVSRAWNKFEYFVPIELVETVPTEVKEDLTGQPFLVRGTAINETITRNNVKYPAEELKKGVHTLQNKPILKDHNNSVDSIVGRTTENVYFDEITKSIKFEGKIMEKKYQDMIKDGRITNVSIGASVKDLVKVESDDTSYLEAKGLEFLELSLVPVPGDAHATIGQALAEAYDWKIATENALQEVEKEVTTMVEDNTPKPEDVPVVKEGKPVEVPPIEEKVHKHVVSVEGLDEVQKMAKENVSLVKENEELKKKLDEEVKKLQEKTKGLVETKKATADFGHYCIEREGGLGIFMMPNADGTFPIKRGD